MPPMNDDPLPGVASRPAGIAGWRETFLLSIPLSKAQEGERDQLSLLLSGDAGRILQYSLGGVPLLYENELERGKRYSVNQDSADIQEFHQFGGVRFDIAPQEGWRRTAWGKSWPPPPALNGPRRLAISAEGALFSLEDADHLRLALDVDVRLSPGSSALRIEQRITNLASSPQSWTSWVVVQLAAKGGSSQAIVGNPPKNGAPIPLMPSADGIVPLERKGNTLSISCDGREWKLGFPERSWIAFRPGKDDEMAIVLLSLHPEPAVPAPDRDCPIQLFSSGGLPYMEIEATGALRPIPTGGERSDAFLLAAARCRGAIQDLSPLGITSRPLAHEGGHLRGSFGVFFAGRAILWRGDEKRSERIEEIATTPLEPLEIDLATASPRRGEMFLLEIVDETGTSRGQLGSTIPA